MTRRGQEPALALAGVVMALGALGGCGGGAPTRTLTSADVTGLPAGDATGTAFSGSYLIVAADITGCHCRVGICDLHAQIGHLLTFNEQDGLLTVTADDGTAGNGGIDQDGAFRFGGSAQTTTVTTYTLYDGRVTAVDGKPASAEADVDTTFTTPPGIAPAYDCDLRLTTTLRFDGP